MPPVTRALTAFIIIVFLAQTATLLPSNVVCFSGFGQGYATTSATGFGSLWEKAKAYRYLQPNSWAYAFVSFFLAPYAHQNLLHIVMNLLALVSQGALLEKSIRASSPSSSSGGSGSGATIVNGIITQPSISTSNPAAANYFSLPSASSTFLALTLLLHLTTSTTVAFLHLIPYETFNLHGTCMLGFSGILFGYIAYLCYTAPRGSQMLLCGSNVPAIALPWILILVTFLLMPASSFTGHLAGVLWGIGFARVPVFADALRGFGNVLARSAAICPPFLRSGGLSRGTSPTNSFAVRSEAGVAGTSTTQTNGGTFQMGNAVHPNDQDWAAAEEGRAQPVMGTVVREPAQGIPMQQNINASSGPSVTQQGSFGGSAQQFKAFQGEGRKLGGN
eukprot:GILI01030632.1.p1 GENE.GILI01030632.1~~GILI01030632.1.p1  ORF type:complete len:427 (+),score=37.90 GILI01030632.1:114-1283(+)